jgi:hypothetical protein
MLKLCANEMATYGSIAAHGLRRMLTGARFFGQLYRTNLMHIITLQNLFGARD